VDCFSGDGERKESTVSPVQAARAAIAIAARYLVLIVMIPVIALNEPGTVIAVN
jgi:hypothetical protein